MGNVEIGGRASSKEDREEYEGEGSRPAALRAAHSAHSRSKAASEERRVEIVPESETIGALNNERLRTEPRDIAGSRTAQDKASTMEPSERASGSGPLLTKSTTIKSEKEKEDLPSQRTIGRDILRFEDYPRQDRRRFISALKIQRLLIRKIQLTAKTDLVEGENIVRSLKEKLPRLFDTDISPGSRQAPIYGHIETTGQPIKARAYRMPPKEEEIVAKEIDNMLEAKVIRPSESPWASNVVLVKKKDGTIRFCVNYKKMNAQTTQDAYPLPRIEETLEKVAGCERYTTLDLRSAYWQIPMDQESIPKTAFTSK